MSIYNHQKNVSIGSTIREVVFGVEDGMVSTLGAITGIAIGSQDYFTVILAGLVIISVESISMGIGSYLANRSERDVNQRRIAEEKEEIHKHPKEEKNELENMFIRDGWSSNLAQEMSIEASQNKELILKEMSYRELGVSQLYPSLPIKNAVFMYLSYIIGGLIPLVAYFFLPVLWAMPVSIFVTLVGLFILGVATTKYTKVSWFKSGMRILIFGSVALSVGFVVGKIVTLFQ
jgi:VIT1/CCC1 family predicted Fe2+/Mn2+ transporter